ncbi:AAA family ATPase [Paenibacillus sp. SYP-B4298]|uniref:AAA family ATPase n=1 Tax=Paenibacillus sp. SYP-B4298 TaxID=2996034 RepID=UPI0022DE8779|nr:AAA family ATPase [Paenibacillus sp. SYP-B4298]
MRDSGEARLAAAAALRAESLQGQEQREIEERYGSVQELREMERRQNSGRELPEEELQRRSGQELPEEGLQRRSGRELPEEELQERSGQELPEQELQELHEIEARQQLERLSGRLNEALLGKEEVVRLALAALLAGGHLLLEDVPGVGKTLLARAFAGAIGGTFGRIQFTPDLQPADITGGSIWDARQRDFVYRPGPLMNHVVLADELNRTMPRTQAALLEAMEERRMTIDGVTRELPEPFMLIATQNPLQDEGTFPLPGAQLDRFIMRLGIGYPSVADEVRMLEHSRPPARQSQGHTSVMPAGHWLELQRRAARVSVHRSLLGYAVQVVTATRQSAALALGASPRATRDWVRAAQGTAYLDGREYVVPDDLKATALPVLAHRLVPRDDYYVDGRAAEQALEKILRQCPLPGELDAGRRLS